MACERTLKAVKLFYNKIIENCKKRKEEKEIKRKRREDFEKLQKLQEKKRQLDNIRSLGSE